MYMGDQNLVLTSAVLLILITMESSSKQDNGVNNSDGTQLKQQAAKVNFSKDAEKISIDVVPISDKTDCNSIDADFNSMDVNLKSINAEPKSINSDPNSIDVVPQPINAYKVFIDDKRINTYGTSIDADIRSISGKSIDADRRSIGAKSIGGKSFDADKRSDDAESISLDSENSWVYDDDDYDDDEDSLGDIAESLRNSEVRRIFVLKVYMITTIQFTVTQAFVTFFLFHAPTKWFIVGEGMWFYYLNVLFFLATYLTLVCVPGLKKYFTLYVAVLALFTIVLSSFAAAICLNFTVSYVLMATFVCGLVGSFVTLFAALSPIDSTTFSGVLFTLLLFVLLYGFLILLAYLVFNVTYTLQLVLGNLAALFFAIYLVYETQLLLGGRKHSDDTEEYISAALHIYLHIIYLFFAVLVIRFQFT